MKKTSDEFKVGNHSIGYISSDFKKLFGNIEFEPRELPTFQKLPHPMSDAEIENELKPGFCEIGDVLAFIENAPAECKDGYANLFYTESCVVGVRWDRFHGGWSVGTWSRDGVRWSADSRVFSPATGSSNTRETALEPSDTLNLEKAIEMVKGVGYKIFKEI